MNNKCAIEANERQEPLLAKHTIWYNQVYNNSRKEKKNSTFLLIFAYLYIWSME